MVSAIFFLLAAVFALPSILFLAYYPFLALLARVSPWKGPADAGESPPERGPAIQHRHARAATPDPSPSVALALVAGRQDASLERKVAELTGLHEHASVIEVFVGLDGDTAPADEPGPITWIGVTPRQGKNAVLREIHRHAMADVLVFTDVDARLEPACLDAVLAPLIDARIGAVTGRRQIVDDTGFGQAQAGYADLDNEIRKLEMRCIGSVTTCEGKLYAVRRELLDAALPDDGSDDLHYGLGAVAGGTRLVFAPDAIARIGRPARDLPHEFDRRRRVTCRGLATLEARRELLDPRRHGRFAVGLLFNKLFRRVACPSALLAALALVAAVLTLPVGASGFVSGFRAVGIVAVLSLFGLAIVLTKGRGGALAYLALGMLGTTFGVLDYLRGHRVTVWESVKSDDDASDGGAEASGTERHSPETTAESAQSSNKEFS